MTKENEYYYDLTNKELNEYYNNLNIKEYTHGHIQEVEKEMESRNI